MMDSPCYYSFSKGNNIISDIYKNGNSFIQPYRANIENIHCAPYLYDITMMDGDMERVSGSALVVKDIEIDYEYDLDKEYY